MLEITSKDSFTIISRISWYWKDLVFSFSEIDPALLFTVLQCLTFGNYYFREYAHYNYAFYISRSPFWIDTIMKYNLNPEDLCSSYGIFAIPYLYAYSFGYRDFDFISMYDVDIMRPYIIKYITRLTQRHNKDIGWILLNYKYLGNINKRTVNKFRKDFKSRKRFYSIIYFSWKNWLNERGLWHDTIIL